MMPSQLLKTNNHKIMKKFLFGVLLAVLLASAGLALASDNTSQTPLEELMLAVADLKSQVAVLRAELKAEKAKEVPPQQAVVTNFAAKENVGVSHSERYAISNINF